ncbi:hypothetical protein WJX72_000828 [[Myrmecia] bisecta]|uniref:Uncharacterized protein n=1 Tax=[Myrmecia] bisecta TaxID=41462 RepID=A0AAW1PMX4_9CHLO
MEDICSTHNLALVTAPLIVAGKSVTQHADNTRFGISAVTQAWPAGKLTDLVSAIPMDESHVELVRAGRGHRQGIRTVVLSDKASSNDRLAEGKQFNETWAAYPDDSPLRSLYPGDSRAALAPFVAHSMLDNTFKWLLYGDDDTIWFLKPLMAMLEPLDPEMPYVITDHLWWSPANEPHKGLHPATAAPRCLPCNFDDSDQDTAAGPFPAPKGCPCTAELLCRQDTRGFFNSQCDMPRAPARIFSLHGGAGAVISIGLLKAVGLPFMEKCVKSLYSTGGDAFITICLWQAGYGITDPGTFFYRHEVQMFDPGPEDRMGVLMKLIRMVERGSSHRCDKQCTRQLDNMVTLHVRSRVFPSIDDAVIFMKTLTQLYEVYVELKQQDEIYGERSQPVLRLSDAQEEALRKAHEQGLASSRRTSDPVAKPKAVVPS